MAQALLLAALVTHVLLAVCDQGGFALPTCCVRPRGCLLVSYGAQGSSCNFFYVFFYILHLHVFGHTRYASQRSLWDNVNMAASKASYMVQKRVMSL